MIKSTSLFFFYSRGLKEKQDFSEPHQAPLEGVRRWLKFNKAVSFTYYILRKKNVFFVCELKTPLRTNAPRRQAVLPLRSLHSLLKARRKLKNKAQSNDSSPKDLSGATNKNPYMGQEELYKISEIQIFTFRYTLYLWRRLTVMFFQRLSHVKCWLLMLFSASQCRFDCLLSSSLLRRAAD